MKHLAHPALILILVLPLLFTGRATATNLPSPISNLQYVESSSGLETPQLNGGRTEVEIGDVNGDGHPDIVSIGDHGSPFIGTNEHGVMVWFGDGAGNWSVFQSGNFGYGGIALGDVNNDGLVDVGYGMHHNYSSNDFGDQLIEVALGDGSGMAWTPWDDGLATAGESYGMFGTDFADLDNDGDLDLASISFGCCNGWRVYRNEGDGTWTAVFGVGGGNSEEEIVFADVNGDGDADVIAGHDEGTVFIGDGAGGFTLEDGNLPPSGAFGRQGIAAGDVNGDGRDEVAFCRSGAVHVWSWTAPQTWANLLLLQPPLGSCQATQIADMNGDGHGDVTVYLNGGILVIGGNGAGQWRRLASFPVPGGIYAAMRVGDADHNGRPDIALVAEEGGGFDPPNHLRFYKEASVPMSLSGRLLHPRGGETWVAGSARFVDWLAAVPVGQSATAELELSTSGPSGPWTMIAEELPNSGRYQWLIPADTTPTAEAYLRLTLTTTEDAVMATAGPFTIAAP